MNNRIILSGILPLTIALTFFGCQNNESNSSTESQKTDLASNSIISQNGAQLISSNCYVCHNPNSNSHEEIIAPPLAGIKERYLKASTDRADFINKMTSFAYNPSKDKALMKGPVKRFGLMPKTALSEDEIKVIINYIHDNDIPAPKWFNEHKKKH
ncbi:c-type cytochrome [Marivirga arenosa]|uniref:Cytochrome c n=1 Tax=Marivirga arenosa TaxID=3059076 RepID=A0AA49GE69_9BACT|nr:cytochrome c [Marivirga sp. BKB1-2]WKK80057.2 cytochrome c [Marivirga sp. BKB1-2]